MKCYISIECWAFMSGGVLWVGRHFVGLAVPVPAVLDGKVL